jgi:hypothetical protein
LASGTFRCVFRYGHEFEYASASVGERYGSRGRRERLTTSINSTRRRTCIRWFAAFWQLVRVDHTGRNPSALYPLARQTLNASKQTYLTQIARSRRSST